MNPNSSYIIEQQDRIKLASYDEQNLDNLIQSNHGIGIIEIQHDNHDFLLQDSFYDSLYKGKSLFFVDLIINEATTTFNDEIITKLKASKKPMIIQSRSVTCTKVYSKEVGKLEIVDLNTPPVKQYNESDLDDKLLKEEAFGLSSMVDFLKLKLIGKFNNDRRSLTEVTFKDQYIYWLVYYAISQDSFLLVRLLSLFYEDVSVLCDKEDSNYGPSTLIKHAVEYASVNTLAGLLKHQLHLSAEKHYFSENVSNILNLSTGSYQDTPLFKAIENGKIDIVEFFIQCGADVHCLEKYSDKVIYYAWEREYYDIILVLLKAGFSKEIKLSKELYKIPEEHKLRKYFDDGKELLEFIRKGNLDHAKNFVLINKSVYYLENPYGKSEILELALSKEQFEVFSFLYSEVGIDFKNEEECNKHFKKLSEVQRYNLGEIISKKFSQISDAHILFLVSKSAKGTSFGNDEEEKGFKAKVEELFRALNRIPAISPILRVLSVQHSELGKIIFDFTKESVIGLCPLDSHTTSGLTDYSKGCIYLGAKGNGTLGSLAHELTHFAMCRLYNNDYKPYSKSDGKNRENFKRITEGIISKIVGNKIEIDSIDERSIKEKINTSKTNIDDILKNAFTNYPLKHWDSELIVRIPHLHAKYNNETEKLSSQLEIVDELNNFYKTVVISECERFIEEQNLIEIRKYIKLLNQYLGIVDHIKKMDIKFKKSIQLNDFLSQQKQNFLIIQAKSIWLSVCNVYQALTENIEDDSKFKNCFFLRFNQFKLLPILNAFKSDAIDLLIMMFTDEKLVLDVLDQLEVVLSHKPKKKIILITEENAVLELKNHLNTTLIKKLNLDCLEECKDENFTLNNLTVESQNKILQREIVFQGNQIHLRELIDENNEEQKGLIVSETLVKLINGEKILIGNDSPISNGYDKDYYIDRTFNRQIEIKREIFTDKRALENEYLLVVSNIDKEILKKLVKIHSQPIHLFTDIDLNINNQIKYVLLDNQNANDQFQTLCEHYPTHTIHWLQSESNKFIWKKSQGTISNLIEYRDEKKINSSDIKNINLKDDDLITHDNQSKVIIISDVAGMGKSTVLTHLSAYIQSKFRNMWIIRIDLNNCSKALDAKFNELKLNKSKSIKFNRDTAIEFLLKLLDSDEKSKLKTSLEIELLKHCFKYENKITVMFDGFDEIQTYKEIVLDLLQVLKITSVNKLWITTRSHIRQKIEEELDVFAYTLEPFSESNQVEFLIKFWKRKLNLVFNQENEVCLKKYAKTLINKFGNSISDRNNEFTGIPLQMRLLAEVFQKNTEVTKEKEWQGCEEFVMDNNKDQEPKLSEKLDLFGLYEKFIEKKIYLSLEEKQIIPDFTKLLAKVAVKCYYDEFKKSHELLALHILLKDEDLAELLSEEEKEKIQSYITNNNDSEKNTEIIYKIINGKAHFIHLTFAEYFASFPLVKRLFINFPKSISSLRFIDTVIAGTSPVFINSIIKLFATKKSELENLLEGKTLLNFAVQKGYLNFVQALLETGYDNYPERDNMNKTPLHYAAEYGHSHIVKYLLNYYNDISEKDILDHGCFKNEEYAHSKLVTFVNKNDNDGNSAIYYAAKEGKMEIACDLLLRGANSDALKEHINDVTLYVTRETRSVYANDVHKLRPILEKLLLTKLCKIDDNDRFPRLLAYYFLNGRVKVIDVLLKSIDAVEKRKLLNVEDNGYTPLDRIIHSDQLNDYGRLIITNGLLKNGGKKSNSYFNTNFYKSPERPRLYITKILDAAAQRDHIKTFKYFMNKEKRCYYYLHLYTAAKSQQFNIFKYLFKKHRKNIVHNGNTALHTAIHSGLNLKAVKYLIDNGEDINAKNDSGDTPLFQAIYGNRRLNIVKYLLDHKADINIENNQGKTPLYYAIINEMEDISKYLLNCNAESSLFSDELIKNNACFFRDPSDFDLNGLNNYFKKFCFSKSDILEWVNFLIRNGANVNIKDPYGKTPLHWACDLKKSEIVKLLLQYGAIFDEMDTNNKTPLDLYGSQTFEFNPDEKLDADKLLILLKILFESQNLTQNLNKGRIGEVFSDSWDSNNPALFIINARNSKEKSLLHIATNTNSLEAIETLLKLNDEFLKAKLSQNIPRYKYYQPMLIDPADHEGNTPMHLAAQKGYDSIVSLFLRRGAVFNLKNNENQTPEQLANNNGHENIINLLQPIKNLFDAINQGNLEQIKSSINKKAFINAKDENDATPLHLAAKKNNIECVKLLLQSGANIEATDIHNNATPLHIATENNNIEIVKLLLKNGAVFNAKYKRGKAPFELDEKNECVDLLNAINKLFNDIQNDNPEVIIDYLETIRKEHNIDINTIINSFDDEYYTLLHYAAEFNYFDIIKVLLQNGASFDVRNRLDQEPKDLAKYGDVKDLLELIEEMFFDVNYVMYEKAKKINLKILTNVRDKEGRTLLHKAAEMKKLKVVNWLIERLMIQTITIIQNWTSLRMQR